MILVLSGSPRRGGNTDYVCSVLVREFESMGLEARFYRVADYRVEPCRSCRLCLSRGSCVIDDDMTRLFYRELLDSKAIVVASPVYFNSVPAQLKAFIDRTWCLRGRLRNKIGGVVVVGRRYGHEQAVNTLLSFMLKHEMIIGMRGVCVYAYGRGEAEKDVDGIRDVVKLARRVHELLKLGFTKHF